MLCLAELGELEKKREELDKRKLRLVVISNDEPKIAQETQADFPSLIVVSDPDQSVAKAMQVIHPGAAPGGADTNAPTTFLIDGAGYVRWHYRPERFLTRLSPEELLAAIDEASPR